MVVVCVGWMELFLRWCFGGAFFGRACSRHMMVRLFGSQLLASCWLHMCGIGL